MIDIRKNGKIHLHWKVSPYDFSREREDSLMAIVSTKYGIPKDKVKVIPEFIMVNDDGDEVKLSSTITEDIQKPHFQQELFKRFIKVNDIKECDFEKILEIDGQINNLIDYDVYDKFRRYTVKWIRWNNFLSYGDDNFFDFTKLKGLVLLNGEPANQSGKTTFAIDLLHFLLFGKTTKAQTQEKVFNKHIPEATEVNVEGCITIDDVDYVIKRTLKRPSLSKRSSRSKTVQKVDYYKIVGEDMEELVDYVDNQQEENSIQTNKVIKEAIGKEDDFDLIICATSSNLDDLIEKKETDRGRILSRWIGLMPIEEKDRLAREKFNSEIKPYLLSNTYSTEGLKQNIETDKQVIETSNAAIAKYGIELDKIEKDILEKTQIKEALLTSKSKIDDSLLKLDITTHRSRMEQIMELGKKKSEESKNVEEEISSIGNVDFSMQDYEKLHNEEVSLTSERSVLLEKYKGLVNEQKVLTESEYCPTCKRKLDNVDNSARISEIINEQNICIAEGKKKASEIEAVKKELQSMSKNRELYDRKNKLEIMNAGLKQNVLKLREEYKDAKAILDEYNKNTEAIDKNNEIDIKIRNVDSMILNQTRTKETTIREIEVHRNEIANRERNIKESEQIIQRLEQESINVRHWKIYQDMVGKNGITKMVLRDVLPHINARIAALLSDVGDFTVEITITEKNDIMFFLVKDGVYSDITSASGFEKTAAALALRFVLGGISTLPRANFVILDELFGRVANNNLENIRTLLNKVMEDYDFILQISHLDQIKDWHDEIITVKKEANISKICLS